MHWAVRVTMLLAALAPQAVAAADPPAEKTGIAVGDKAPKFTLKDQDGKERTLDEFIKRGTVGVVFTRSAGW
jgi:cytochrome oxidase Cu insertion factor (SCO1/SenC/PrrC family)